MDLVNSVECILPLGDEYDKKCGEIFLTRNGNVVFHCTLCESKFLGFHNYFEHVYKRHYTPVSEKRKSTDHLHEMMGYSVKGSTKKETINIPTTPAAENIPPAEKNPAAEKIPATVTIPAAETMLVTETIKPEILEIKTTENSDNLVNEEQFDDESMEQKFGFALDDESSNDYDDDEHYVEPKLNIKVTPRRIKKETELLKCPHCEYSTKQKRHMTDHVKRHVEPKEHKCTECDKAFHKKYELISHTRTHTGERPYLCPDCGRGFGKSSSLLEHVKRHKNIRDKECEVCNMRFYNSKELRIHKAVHSDARPYACTACDKAFKTRLSLKTHTKIHENKREYVCNYCQATFNQSSGLYAHINNKHSYVTDPPVLQTEKTQYTPSFTWC